MPLSRDDRRHLKKRADEARRLLKEEAARWERQDGTVNVQRMLDKRNPGLYLVKFIRDDGQVAIHTTDDDEMILQYYRDMEDPVTAALYREAGRIAGDMGDPQQYEKLIADIFKAGAG